MPKLPTPSPTPALHRLSLSLPACTNGSSRLAFTYSLCAQCPPCHTPPSFIHYYTLLGLSGQGNIQWSLFPAWLHLWSTALLLAPSISVIILPGRSPMYYRDPLPDLTPFPALSTYSPRSLYEAARIITRTNIHSVYITQNDLIDFTLIWNLLLVSPTMGTFYMWTSIEMLLNTDNAGKIRAPGRDVEQESPPAWTQEAYRPLRRKCSLCCSV